MPPHDADRAWRTQIVGFALDHPTAAGHFPGEPIIPGALLLAHMLDAMAGPRRDVACYEVRLVKFLRPVRPGDELTLRWRPHANGEQQFEAWRDSSQETVMLGSAREVTLECE